MTRIGQYLAATKDHNIIFSQNKLMGLECFVNANFAGGWLQADADNPDNVMLAQDMS